MSKMTKQNRFDKAFEKDLEGYTELLFKESLPQLNPFLPQEAKKAKIDAELHQSLSTEELGLFIEKAFVLFQKDGKRFLETAAYESACHNFKETYILLKKLNLAQNSQEKLTDLLQIKEGTTSALFEVARKKLEEDLYEDAFSLFVLLTLLQPDVADYWYRLAIAAQQKQEYALALRSYAVALSLDSKLIGARIYSAECYLNLNESNNALLEYQEAEKLINNESDFLDSPWPKVLSHLKHLIEVHPS